MKNGPFLIGLFLSCHTLFSQVPAEPRYPVVLVQFRDQHFSLESPTTIIADMLSKHGFNYDNATGSVLDYYNDNLNGAFRPSFEVLGLVELEGRMQDYGKDVFENGVRVGDKAPEKALIQACEQLDAEVDFSRYDSDADGVLDLLVMVFAGYDQAAGGKADALWAHQWNVQDCPDETLTQAAFDGVRLGQYIATPELAGSDGHHLNGIGSLCHELGHFLGLPDFYDTDFAAGGNAGGVYTFSLMGKGLYNNNGHTPPSFNLLEKSLLGIGTEASLPELPEGVVRLGTGEVAVSPTQTEGEYFLYEYRDGKGWDAPLPRGLVIYHVDRSAREVGAFTARQLWEDWRTYNGLNASASHPCYALVPSSHPGLLEYDAALSEGQMVFPGRDYVLFYEPVDWEGEYTGVQITNIALEEDGVRFRVLKDAGPNINGTVCDAAGNPLEGVKVSLGEETSAVSGEDGFFRLDLPSGVDGFDLTFYKKGYSSYSQSVSMGDYRMKSLSVTLRQADAPRESLLSPYNTEAAMGYFASTLVVGGVRLSPEELYPYVGQELGEVVFYPYLTSAFEGEIYLVVDLGARRLLTRKLENLVRGPYCKQVVDLSGEHIVIPEGMPLYIGYGSPTPEVNQLNFRVGTVYPAKKGRSYYSPFSMFGSTWKEMYVKSAGIYMDVALTVTAVENTRVKDLVELGYSYIERPQGKIKAGDRIPLIVHAPEDVFSVNWTLDAEDVKGELTPPLKAGSHVLQARILHWEGIEEILEVLLEVD